jgi:hypothetical protein
MEIVILKKDNTKWYYYGTDEGLAVISKETHFPTILVPLDEIEFIEPTK